MPSTPPLCRPSCQHHLASALFDGAPAVSGKRGVSGSQACKLVDYCTLCSISLSHRSSIYRQRYAAWHAPSRRVDR